MKRLRAMLDARAASWARRRQGEDALPIRLAMRRIYILPTRAGLGFGVLLAVMLVAGLNYANSLALFVTFGFGAFALVSLQQCHRTLLGVSLREILCQPGFAGEPLPASCWLVEDAGVRRAGLMVSLALPGGRPASRPLDLPARTAAAASLQLPAQARGRTVLERCEISTCAPFGLFRAWAWVHHPVQVIVYPHAQGTRLPPSTPGEAQGAIAHGPGDDELTELRPFREGDSPRQVAWKAYARGAPLLVKEYRALGLQMRLFDFERLDGLDLEARLSQLTRWIVDAESRGETYELRLPGVRIAPGEGAAHRHRCLTALALHGDAGGPAPGAPR